jgi:hypothetical protein
MLRVVLFCIIANAFLFQGPTIVTTIYGNIYIKQTNTLVYKIVSSLEIAFSVQETMLTALYIYLFVQNTADSRDEPETKRTLYLLIGAECIVLSTDVVLNVLLFAKFYLPRTMVQAFMSMLKLKVEFIILNSLVKYAHAKANRTSADLWLAPVQTSDTPSDTVVVALSREDTVVADSPLTELGGDLRDCPWSRGDSLTLREIV